MSIGDGQSFDFEFMRWTKQQLLDYETRMHGTSPEIGRQIAEKVRRELDLHKQIMDYCDAQWPRWKYIRARSDLPSTIAVGAHDFTIFAPGGRTILIECKRGDGKLSSDQLAWAKELSLLGHQVEVVRSFEEFLGIVK